MWWHNEVNRVFDMDGNAIFNAIDGISYDDLHYGAFGNQNTVDFLDKDCRYDDPLYDILGRRIANPAPGQLYIQGGKKHIAK